MRQRRLPSDGTMLSFLDTLSNGVGAAVLLLMVFGSSALLGGRMVATTDAEFVSVTVTAGADVEVWAQIGRPESSPGVKAKLRVVAPKDAAYIDQDSDDMIVTPSEDGEGVLLVPAKADECVTLAFLYAQQDGEAPRGPLQPLPLTLRFGDAGATCCLSARTKYTTLVGLRGGKGGKTQLCATTDPAICRCGG